MANPPPPFRYKRELVKFFSHLKSCYILQVSNNYPKFFTKLHQTIRICWLFDMTTMVWYFVTRPEEENYLHDSNQKLFKRPRRITFLFLPFLPTTLFSEYTLPSAFSSFHLVVLLHQQERSKTYVQGKLGLKKCFELQRKF